MEFGYVLLGNWIARSLTFLQSCVDQELLVVGAVERCLNFVILLLNDVVVKSTRFSYYRRLTKIQCLINPSNICMCFEGGSERVISRHAKLKREGRFGTRKDLCFNLNEFVIFICRRFRFQACSFFI